MVSFFMPVRQLFVLYVGYRKFIQRHSLFRIHRLPVRSLLYCYFMLINVDDVC